MNKTHHVHESYGDYLSRKKYKDMHWIFVLGIILFILGLGGLLSGIFETLVFIFFISGIIFIILGRGGKKKMFKEIGRGKRISFG